MSYGYFSDGGKSYTITNPLTPSKWVNHLSSKVYQAEIDQTLQGDSRCINQNFNHSNNTTGMRHFYIHDHKSGKSFHLNAIESNPNYLCKFYMNKAVLSNDSDGLKTDVCIYLPTDEQKEIFDKFHDCWSEYMSLAEAAIFEYAFKLGMNISIESLKNN